MIPSQLEVDVFDRLKTRHFTVGLRSLLRILVLYRFISILGANCLDIQVRGCPSILFLEFVVHSCVVNILKILINVYTLCTSGVVVGYFQATCEV